MTEPDTPADRQALDATSPLTELSSLLPELKLASSLVIATIVIAGLYFGRDLLVPLALAALLSFVLDPLVARLKRWGLPRLPAVIVVVAFALSLVALAGVFLGSQVSALAQQLPTYQSNIKTKLHNLRDDVNRPGVFDGLYKTIDSVRTEVDRTTPGTGRDAKGAANAAPPQRVQVDPQPPTAVEQARTWLEIGGGPLSMAGIVFVFVVLVLLDRLDLRDRFLRLWGGSIHRSTDAMDEAGRRISKYLTMQLLVNLSYGIPMGAGLWLIGVPGAILWGAVAAVLRFVPYLGPMISAVFPLALGFAVDPGWSMVLWALALIVSLEMLVNNLVEPWLYGHSTGLSAISLIVAATFWTALWGPIGLIMSTPLTVCLLVIGRHLPRFQFLDVLLGSAPALDPPTRMYQRLLAGDVEEAIELATAQSLGDHLAPFYNDIALPVLRMACADHAAIATEHRHRVVVGMDALIDDLLDQHPIEDNGDDVAAICIGGKWEVDTLAAKMLAHSLTLQGLRAEVRPTAVVSADYIARLDLGAVRTVCISYFSPEPQVQARHFCKRLRRRFPDLKIVLALWNASPELLGEDAMATLGADHVVTSIDEATVRIAQLSGLNPHEGFLQAEIPLTDADRLIALKASGALDPRAAPVFEQTAKRAADIFDVPLAMISLITDEFQVIQGASGGLPDQNGIVSVKGTDLHMPRSMSMCGHVVSSEATMMVPDVARDLRFANNPALQAKGVRFYAGAPLRDRDGKVLGTLCLLDVEPRTLNPRELRLLEAMANDTMKGLSETASAWAQQSSPSIDQPDDPSATIGQLVPSNS